MIMTGSQNSPGNTSKARETNRDRRGKNTFISRKRQRDKMRDRDRVKNGDGEGSKGGERKEEKPDQPKEKEGWRCRDQRGGRERSLKSDGERKGTKRRMRERRIYREMRTDRRRLDFIDGRILTGHGAFARLH